MRYITAIIFASLATGVIMMYVVPTYKKIEASKVIQKDYTEYKTKAKLAQEGIDSLDRKSQTFPVDPNGLVQTIVPDSIDDVQLTMQLTDVAAKNGLSLANPTIRKLAGDKGSTVQEYSVALQVDAPYPIFLSFLNDIEYSLNLRDITSLSITAGENAAAPMKISMEFITYAMK